VRRCQAELVEADVE